MRKLRLRWMLPLGTRQGRAGVRSSREVAVHMDSRPGSWELWVSAAWQRLEPRPHACLALPKP